MFKTIASWFKPSHNFKLEKDPVPLFTFEQVLDKIKQRESFKVRVSKHWYAKLYDVRHCMNSLPSTYHPYVEYRAQMDIISYLIDSQDFEECIFNELKIKG